MRTKLLELRPYLLGVNEELYKMFQEIPKFEEFNQTNEFYGLSVEDLRLKICNCMKNEYGINSKNHETFIMNFVFYVEGYPVGYAGMKIKLNKYWVVHTATIWYKIRPTERNKGYGTKLVRKLVKRANDLGITYVKASVSSDNIASQKILLKNNFEQYFEEYENYFYKIQLREEPIITEKKKFKWEN